MKKRALITGITGQDGSYLAEYLISLGYDVYGLIRRTSLDPLMRIEEPVRNKKIKILYGNMRDIGSLRAALEESKPDEIYNLAAQSDVGISFKIPDETMEIDYYGVGRLAYSAMEQNPKVRIYQASTSEMFGSTKPPQNENSSMNPVSPYAKAKLMAHRDFVVGYREKYGLYICSGILFNHESPRRGEHFVTRKITISLAKIKNGLQKDFELGNLDAKRDWGFAGDYVKVMHAMLQQKKPTDLVIATGESHSVREFFEAAVKAADMKISWHGEGLKEVAKDEKGKVILRINKKFYRPAEVNYLLGDASKARKLLKWKPEVTFDELVTMMVNADMARYSR